MLRKGSVSEKDLRQLLQLIILKNIDTYNYLYAIRKHIHKTFNVNFSFSTIAGVLRRMEENRHLLQSELVKNPIEHNPPRRVYTITEKGELTLSAMLDLLPKI